jgi:excisionase family DNA binding protein
MTAHAAPAPEAREEWLTVQQACSLIGVAPATLRRWSAAGTIPAFTTPGGHRRFARSMILGLLPSTGPRSAAPAPTAGSSQALADAVQARLADVCRDAAWLARLSRDGRTALVEQVGRIAVVLLALADGTDPGPDEIDSAITAAGACGRIAAQGAARIGETVETFLRLRRIVLAELVTVSRRRELDTGALMELLARVNHFGDRLHIAVISGHQTETGHLAPTRGNA